MVTLSGRLLYPKNVQKELLDPCYPGGNGWAASNGLSHGLKVD